jgi:hypothetical protein
MDLTSYDHIGGEFEFLGMEGSNLRESPGLQLVKSF